MSPPRNLGQGIGIGLGQPPGASEARSDAVTEGHSLVIPRRHLEDGMVLHQPEWNAVVALLKQRREQLGAPRTPRSSVGIWG